MNKLPILSNKTILLYWHIPDPIINPFSGNSLNTGLIVLLGYEIYLFHNFIISPLAFLHWDVLDVVLVFDVFSSVGLVGFAALGLERRRLGDRLVDDEFVLDLVAAGDKGVAEFGGKFGGYALLVYKG
jgi:hypothetical protein